MDLNSRVQKIINYSELSLSEFADEIGVQRSNISHVLSGRNKPSLDFLMKIKDRFPEIQWEWLIEGKGAMIFSEEETASTPSTYLLEESKINDDEPIITGLFSIPSQEMDENTKQEEEKSEISEPIQYNNIVENINDYSLIDKIEIYLNNRNIDIKKGNLYLIKKEVSFILLEFIQENESKYIFKSKKEKLYFFNREDIFAIKNIIFKIEKIESHNFHDLLRNY